MKSPEKTVILAFCALLLGSTSALHGQEYPAKAVRMVVPFPVGGAPDVIARAVGVKLAERLGQQMVIENRLGAGGNIAYDAVAKAAPDGYTVLFAATGLATNISLYSKLPYDPVRDFAPISLVASSAHVLVAHPDVPARSIQELIALAKEKPGSLTFGSSGSGTVLHLAGEMFNAMAGVKLVHVPYKGATLVRADLLSGRVGLMFSDLPSALPHVRSGSLRALGVTGAQRLPIIPEVSTIAEAGVPGYAIKAWFGLLAPAGVPAPIVTKLNREVLAVLGDAELGRRMAELGQEVGGTTPEEFGAFLKAEIVKMREVVRVSGATVN